MKCCRGLGRLAVEVDDRKAAAQAYLRLYYEFPQRCGNGGRQQLEALQDQIVKSGYQILFRPGADPVWRQAAMPRRAARSRISRRVGGDDEKSGRSAPRRVRLLPQALRGRARRRPPVSSNGPRARPKRASSISAPCASSATSEPYVAQTRALVSEFPDDSWSEEALNNLGTHYIVTNEDDSRRADVHAELVRAVSDGHAQPSARPGSTAGGRTTARATMRRPCASSSAPPRTFPAPTTGRRFCIGRRARTEARMARGPPRRGSALVYTDYMNSYYGRLAPRRSRLPPAARHDADSAVGPPALQSRLAPRRADRRLASASCSRRLYDEALDELRFAQRAWGTVRRSTRPSRWVYHEKGELRRRSR